jgi:hypothetical protein
MLTMHLLKSPASLLISALLRALWMPELSCASGGIKGILRKMTTYISLNLLIST